MRREEQEIYDGIYLYIPGIFPDHYGTTSTNFGIFIVNDYPYPYPPTAEYRVIITDTLGSYDYPTGIPVWLSNVYDSGGIGRVYSVFVENWDVVHPLIKAMVLKYVVCPYAEILLIVCLPKDLHMKPSGVGNAVSFLIGKH